MASPREPPPWSKRSDRKLLLAFACVVASFILSTAFSQYSESSIHTKALEISDHAAPAIEHLTRARVEISNLVRAVLTPPTDTAEMAAVQRHYADEIAAYAIVGRPAEVARVRGDLLAGIRDLEDVLRHPPVTIPIPASQRLSRILSQTIDSNAQYAQELASRIKSQHQQTERVAAILDALCVLLAALAARWALRASRNHTALLEAHSQLETERAEELERFADRVAHDLRGPLSAVALGIEAMRRSNHVAVELLPTMERIKASLQRGQRIITSLLEFARAAARPYKPERCQVAAVLDDVLAEVHPLAEEAQVQLALDPPAPASGCEVACGAGILTSLLLNVLSNAIKYMGDSPVRRVQVRVINNPDDASVRVEIEDTGPGLPAGMTQTVFTPYVRATKSTQPGLGLGLATVKRLAEAHGGAVGVHSRSSGAPADGGPGSLFWFQLPRPPS